MSSLSNKLSTLSQKTADLTVKEVKLPESAASPLALFESNSAAKSATSNEWIIDLFPNQIPPMLFILQLAVKYSALIDHKEHPKSSLATVALYLATLFQAFFLLNDMHVRPTASAAAQSWSQLTWKKKFADFLLTLPVPTEMEFIFSQLYATTTDRTNNVFTIPSAAGFQHDHFLGKFIPLAFFTHLHDCIATMPGNSKSIDITNNLLSRVMYRLKTTANPDHTYVAYFADFLGVTVTTTTGNFLATKFNQVFKSVFNPVLFRDFHRRSSLATLDMKVPTFKTQYPNYYDLAFSATSLNLAELKVALQSMASLLHGTVPMSKNMCQVISAASGINALHHGYSTYSLPLHTSNNDLEDNTTHEKVFPTLTATATEQPFTRAANISFLQPNTQVTPTTAVIDAEDSNNAADSVITRHWPFSLITTASNAANAVNPKPAAFVTMTEENEHTHTYPRVLVLDVLGTKTVSAHLATLTGKIIESFELDGSTIEQPNIDKSLGPQNSLFADSAIPYKYAVRTTKFYKRTSGSINAPLARAAANSTRRLPASSLLHDRTTVRLPSIQLNIVDANVPTTLPGFTLASNWQWLAAVQSFIGFKTVNQTANTDALDSVPAMQKGRLLIWSPYTYTPYEDQDNEDLTPDLAESRHYFIMNLRTLFGTDTNLIEVVHPLEALPVL